MEDFTRRADILAAEQKALENAEIVSYELYHLGRDIGEKTDLAATEPEQLKRMAAELEKKYREVQAESVTWPEWKWIPYEGPRIKWADYKGKQPKKR